MKLDRIQFRDREREKERGLTVVASISLADVDARDAGMRLAAWKCEVPGNEDHLIVLPHWTVAVP